MGKGKKARAAANKKRKEERAQQVALGKAREQYMRIAKSKMDELAQAATREQYVAMLDSPHSKADPVTGRAADPSRPPKSVGGPFYSKPYGWGKKKVRKWYLRPVGWRGPDNVVISALTILWASFEEVA